MQSMPTRTLPPELRRLQLEIEARARSYGLDFFDTIFEMVDYDEMSAIAAHGGFPNRYPHWRFGMEYEQLSKSYTYGLSKIYELVINNDPCYAYLLDSNPIVDQKLVMAHVCGHCDFFKHNVWFSHTSRKMMDETANHGNRVRELMDRHGEGDVEDFIDVCLSVEDLIDIHSPFIRRRAAAAAVDPEARAEKAGGVRFDAKEYLDAYVNPKAAMKAESDELERVAKERAERFPTEPERDVLLFILEYGSLKPWQRDVLSIVRDEAYYFAPQGQTKIMNEGWASYWHSTLMCGGVADDSEIVDFADHHSGTMAMGPGGFNPYKVGIELFRDIEDRWNHGRFGKEYEECPDYAAKREWDLNLGLGRKKIFEVRRTHNDVTFIDTFLTEEFCRRHKFFAYGYEKNQRRYQIESREFEAIKERLLFQLTNHGRPFIRVADGNFRNRGELYLKHQWLGVELKFDYAHDVLVNLWKLWGRPVHVETRMDDKDVFLSYNGSEHSTSPAEK
ncbi:MAG: SpoVR family protein [Planctomycetia bacterium]